MKKKILVPLFSFITILSFVLAGCGTSSNSATPTPYPTKVRKTYTVGKGDIVIDLELFGQVASKALSTAYFQMNGHVGEVYVQVNDIVKKGQLLADLTELKDIQATAITTRDAILRAQINVEIAQLTLAKFKAEGRPDYEIQIQEKQIDLAQIDLNEILVKIWNRPEYERPGCIGCPNRKSKIICTRGWGDHYQCQRRSGCNLHNSSIHDW